MKRGNIIGINVKNHAEEAFRRGKFSFTK